jgi:MFS family permease
MFEIILIIIAIAPEGILEAMLIPLFPYIASSFNSDNGIDSGLLTSAFFMPLFLMNIVWGIISDAYGRKYVLIAGLAIGLVSALIVGEAETFTVVFLGRLLAGFFGSNSTVAKSMMGDISTSSKELAWAYSTYGAVYGMSGILGPMLAGILYDPAKLYPNKFSKDGFFGSKPLRLVCYFGAGLTFVSLIMTVFCLKEKKKIRHSKSDPLFEEEVPLDTAPQMNGAEDEDLVGHQQKGFLARSLIGSKKRYTALSDSSDFHDSKRRSAKSRGPKYFAFITQSPLYKAKVIFAISLYVIIAAAQMVYNTSIPLFFQSSTNGISLSAQETSLLLMVVAMVKFPIQVYGFQKIIIYFKNLESCYCVYLFD